MQKRAATVAIALTLGTICSSHNNARAEVNANQPSQAITEPTLAGQEQSPIESQPLCPKQKHIGLNDFGKINQAKNKKDAIAACSIIESMLRQADHKEPEIRLLLVAGAATAGSLVTYHNEIDKGLLLFRKIERIAAAKSNTTSISKINAEEKRLALALFYRAWGASALFAGDYATASKSIDLAIAHSSTAECPGECDNTIEDNLESLKLRAGLQSAQGDHTRAAETRQRITKLYRITFAKSSHSKKLLHQGFIESLIEEGWARLDIGDYSGAKKLISEAQEFAKTFASPDLADRINEIKAALNYRAGSEITNSSATIDKLNQSAYNFAQGDKDAALSSFSDSVKEVISKSEELRQRAYDKEIALNYKEMVLSIHQAIYSMALINNDKHLDTAASILSLNTHGLILDVELSRHAGSKAGDTQIERSKNNTEGVTSALIYPEDIGKKLKSNEILIEFRRFQEWQMNNGRASRPLTSSSYIGISIDSRGITRSHRIGNTSDVDEKINRALSSTSQNLTDAAERIIEAGDYLLAAFNLPKDMRPTIYISADGEINRFPFSAYAIIKNNLSVNSIVSGRSLLTMEKQSNPKLRMQSLVLSSPDYGISQKSHHHLSATSRSDNRIKWEPLPYARREGDLVAQILEAKHLYGDAADEAAIKRAQNPHILHIASHGYFRDNSSTGDTPSSAVVLAGANNTDPLSGNASDGYLTATESSHLDLYGTELVVLSACSTGQGDIRTGEGVYGLQRALSVAGARSTLLSLWKVDDEATAEFMERFYTRLKDGEGRSDALAATQREFRDGTAGDGQWKDPYYWAAWQLVGDWRPIKGL